MQRYLLILIIFCTFSGCQTVGDQSSAVDQSGEIEQSATIESQDLLYFEGCALYSATVCYPVGGESLPVIIITNGFLGSKDSIRWIAESLPGYVTLTFTPPNVFSADQTLWARGFLGAIELLKNYDPDSELSRAMDLSRIGLIGNSMGGGGCIEASALSPDVDVSVGLAPAGSQDGWDAAALLDHPTLILTGDNDQIVPSAGPLQYYQTIPATTMKSYLQFRGVNHQANMDRCLAELGMLITDDGDCELGIDGQHALLSYYFKNWFDYYLLGEGEPFDLSELDDPAVVNDYYLNL